MMISRKEKGAMMKASGLIVEYNPFHNGHKYHFEKACEIDKESIKIAVMSGDFVQRGEPAVINRWKRAEMALKNGIDRRLLFELCSVVTSFVFA